MMEPWDGIERPWICVVSTRSGAERYLGTCCGAAAHQLEPGCCYGIGATQAEARRVAAEERQRFLRLEPIPKPIAG